MFQIFLLMIITLIDWTQSAMKFYVHLKSTFEAAIYIAKHDYPRVITERKQANLPSYPRPPYRSKLGTKQKNFRSLFAAKKSFLVKLPNELLIKIFEQLGRRDLFHCVAVCNRWNQLAIPLLWSATLPKHPIVHCLNETTKHSHRPSSKFPIQMARYGQAIRTLDLSLVDSNINDCTVQYIVRHCTKLNKLSLLNCTDITDESLRLLARSPIAGNLRALILQNCRNITDNGLQYLAEGCQQLEVLHFGGCDRITNGGVNRLMTSIGKTIRNLRMNDCALLTGLAIQSVARHCGPTLQLVDFSYIPFTHTDLLQLAIQCPNITHLDLSLKRPLRFGDAGRALIVRVEEERHIHEFGGIFDSLYYHQIRPNLSADSARHLEHIMEQRRLRDLVNDRTVIRMASHLLNLKRLDLSYWTCLTDNSIRAVTDNCTELTSLNLQGCSSITKTTHKYCRSLRSLPQKYKTTV